MKYDVKEAGRYANLGTSFPLKHRLSEFENWPHLKKTPCIYCRFMYSL